MATWKQISLGWVIATICGFVAAYGVDHDTQWWAWPLISLSIPACLWLLFGSIITLVKLSERI